LTMKPMVAIVGRPNVGKSALFNRLVGRRLAIVHAQSGVTRDRMVQEVCWRNRRFDLTDTGGITASGRERDGDFFEEGIRRQVDAALADAAAVILTTDIESGLHSADCEAADRVRRAGLPVALAANKADSPEKEALAGDFAGLGFPVFPVSALQNRGIQALMEHVAGRLPEQPPLAQTDPLKIAIVGRPNVGKSSFINRLLREERMIVSDVPGTTRDSVDIPFAIGKGDAARPCVLIDTAGLRRSAKITEAVERFGRFRAENSIRRSDVTVLLLDAVAGPTAFDKKIAALIASCRKGCLIAVNKWDLAEETQRQWGPRVAREMPFMEHCPLVFFSAKTGYNIRQSLEAMDHVAAQTNMTLPTGLLNRVLNELQARAQTPVVRGKRPKLFYATQTGRAPIRVQIFASHPRSIAPAYRTYLIHGLRRRFGLEGAPVVLEFRARESAPRNGEVA